MLPMQRLDPDGEAILDPEGRLHHPEREVVVPRAGRAEDGRRPERDGRDAPHRRKLMVPAVPF